MSFTHTPAEDFAYPVLLIQKDTFEVWSQPGSANNLVDRLVETNDRVGVLIDREGRSYRVVDAKKACMRDGQYPRHLSYTAITLVCDGQASSMSVDDVRQGIAWIISAKGHFESPTGFEFPYGFATANSVAELLQILATTRFRG